MQPEDDQIRARYQAAVRWARQAGEHTLKFFQQDSYDVTRKSDGSPVTQADQETETLLRDWIRHNFPDDGILGEEYGEIPGTSSFVWILDPIDGTKSFISGVPLYGTLVAVQQHQRTVIGVIEIPALNERVYAAKNTGAWHVRGDQEAQPAHVLSDIALQDGLLLTSAFQGFVDRGAADAWKQLEASSWFARTWGDCYGYLLVATGRALAMIDPELNVWDAAAVQVVIEEAGGQFTDWHGNHRVDSGDGIGASPEVLKQILAITQNAPPLDAS